MGTWLDDITDPKVRAAFKIVGNQDDVSLRNMIKALSGPLASVLNTQEDYGRLAAAKIVRAYRNRQK